jgi:TrmH family RNA methyltransferase
MISSPQNPKLKLARALLTQAKARRQEGLCALEGLRLVRDALDAGLPIDFILHKPDLPALADLAALGAPLVAVEGRLLDEISETEHNQGLLAVLPIPRLPLDPAADFLLALDGLSDAGNLGTIIRTAAAAGAQGLFLLPGCVDPYNPKVLRAGMGGHFRLPIQEMTWEQLGAQFAGSHQFWAADLPRPGSRPYTDPLFAEPCLLIVGNEAHGLSQQARALGQPLHIPMAGGVESLNSATAAALLLYEVARQRAFF